MARAAGGKEAAQVGSRACRDFLRAVLEICHHLVLSREIGDEWKKHRSSYSSTWLATMFGRKKVARPAVTADRQLSVAIEKSKTSASRRRAMEKDRHLIEAAWATDGFVASLDEKARAALAQLAVSHHPLRRVVWINPAKADEDPLGCLAHDPTKRGRRLG